MVSVESCLLLPERFKSVPAKLSGALGYVFKGQEETLKRVGLRVSRSGGDVELALWTEPGACNRAFVAKVLADTVKTTSLVRVLVKGEIEKRDVRKVEVLAGKGFWQEQLVGFDFKVSAPSFFQTNSDIAEMMIKEVVAWMEDRIGRESGGDGRIIDLYSGVGTFTLPLADVFDDVVAVEMAGSSVRDLRRNLEDNGLYAEVIGGSVERALPELPSGAHIVVDPPRSGLSETARAAIITARPRSIAYVSCDPATLARDLGEFLKNDYTLEAVKPFDMFPRSHHVESIALLAG
ncbi:MAG TPA: hypothetical protein DEB24_03705 [Coriobacteriia bacterium]|nr:hypothetical protein [Coriobacteriia bacterium]